MIGLDIGPIALRALTYLGSVAAAGGVLFAMSFPRAAHMIPRDLERQIVFGCLLLFGVEPLRYVAFQLSIAGGDWSLAFGPDLRWMGMQTPMGQAALMRLVAAIAVLTRPLRIAGATLMVASFAWEGHTASGEMRTALTTGALLLHLAAVHWWFGALCPLALLTRRAEPGPLATAVESFGRRAQWIVASLLAAGALLLVVLTGGEVDLANAYQQRFLLKLALVGALLSIAAWNKLRLTPLLRRDAEAGRAQLHTSIRMEILLALFVLAATAWAISRSPDS